jgi:hypothetical protein
MRRLDFEATLKKKPIKRNLQKFTLFFTFMMLKAEDYPSTFAS